MLSQLSLRWSVMRINITPRNFDEESLYLSETLVNKLCSVKYFIYLLTSCLALSMNSVNLRWRKLLSSPY